MALASTHTARAQHVVTRPSGRRRLALRWIASFRWHLLVLFLSDLGRSMIDRKYDAFTTDNAYCPAPRGNSRLARMVDGIVRRKDTNVALRQRLEVVSGLLTEAVLTKRPGGPVRLASGPVGLGRDVRQAWARLRSLGTLPAQWLEVVGIDLDASSTVLDEAARLARAEGLPLATRRLDLLEPGIATDIGGHVDVFNSIGLGVWLDEDQLRSLLWTIHSALADDGILVIDQWRRHGGSKYVGALQMPAHYISDERFESALMAAGFAIEEKRVTENGVVVVYRARQLAGID
jgi:SAM-dependent methyltransferase